MLERKLVLLSPNLTFGSAEWSNIMDNLKDSVIIGIDLSNDYTQVSFLDNSNDVQSMSTISDEQRYLIPTVMLKLNGSFQWCIGDEALARSEKGEGTLIENIIVQVIEQKSIVLDHNEYFASELLELYFAELFKVIKVNLRTVGIESIVVTVADLDKKLIDVIIDTVTRLGVKKENAKVIGHTESFIYYVLNQKREIWVNNVALFEFTKDYFKYRRLSILNSRNNMVVGVEERDFSKELTYKRLKSQSGKEKSDMAFLRIADSEFAGKVISAVYLTGHGFSKKWSKESLVVLCNKRRVFQGSNLIVKGAGYCAKECFQSSILQGYIFQCAGRTKVNVGIMVNHGGREIEQILSYGGVNWYEAGAYTECILDYVDYIRFNITSPVSGVGKMVYISLKDFPKRPNKTTRVAVTITYLNENQFAILVEDKGFGEFFPHSDKFVREIVTISDEL